MSDSSYLSNAALVATFAILLYAAFMDVKNYRIPNSLVISVGLLFFLHAGLAGRWIDVPGHVGLAILVFAFLLLFYARNWVGGGDVKMLTAAYLWTGIQSALVFSILLCLFATFHILATRFGVVKPGFVDEDGRRRIPFAPSIAASLIGVFALNVSVQ